MEEEMKERITFGNKVYFALIKYNPKVSRLAAWRGNRMHYCYMGLSTAVFICWELVWDCSCNSKFLCQFCLLHSM
jgi:hypothetical protein